jgi:hypothetical protein
VNSDSLPDSIKQQLKAGKLDLKDPANTVALLKLGVDPVWWTVAEWGK